tara:strand:- start:307 stop:564 length:258 start_codon:yes stop_codon:yes gene_type:complete
MIQKLNKTIVSIILIIFLFGFLFILHLDNHNDKILLRVKFKLNNIFKIYSNEEITENAIEKFINKLDQDDINNNNLNNKKNWIIK